MNNYLGGLLLDNFNDSSLLFEHRFWLQILGDHSRFLIGALPSTEVKLIEKSNEFKNIFDSLLNTSRQNLNSEKISELTTLAYDAAKSIRSFKLHIITNQIAGDVKINLPPTFINHMVNEVEEYLKILNFYLNKKDDFLLNPIHYHLLWLSDGSGHADSIASTLDMSEKKLIKISKKFSKNFEDLYLKSVEFKGYQRTGVKNFPALDQLNESANSEMDLFKSFLEHLKMSVMDKETLGTLIPLTLDHMYREECYYQTKLSKVSNIKPPDCDPTKPRINSNM